MSVLQITGYSNKVILVALDYIKNLPQLSSFISRWQKPVFFPLLFFFFLVMQHIWHFNTHPTIFVFYIILECEIRQTLKLRLKTTLQHVLTSLKINKFFNLPELQRGHLYIHLVGQQFTLTNSQNRLQISYLSFPMQMLFLQILMGYLSL